MLQGDVIKISEHMQNECVLMNEWRVIDMTGRINLILQNSTYKQCYDKIAAWEKDRSHCKHDLTHFLDVARITYILTLEEDVSINKEHIYAAALLHDIGRHMEYEEKAPHDKAGGAICVPILQACQFNEEEIACIQEAILSHCNPSVKEHKNLAGYLYRGDKMSRTCYRCHEVEQCEWENKKKNLQIRR